MTYKTILLYIILLFSASVYTVNCTPQLTPKVDERFELTSIIFRLAEAEEYVNNEFKPYIEEVDEYFAKYRSHPVVEFAKEIREKYGVGYDAIASAASLLQIKNNKIGVKSQANLSAYLEIDPRWTVETFKEYVKLSNDFYRKTNFQAFYKKHTDVYAEAEKNLNYVLKQIDVSWFESFYGKPFRNTTVYIALCNGRHNYAMTSFLYEENSNPEIVIGCTQADGKGRAMFNSWKLLPVLIHELAHNYTNPLMLKYSESMTDAAEKIYPHVQQELAQVGYGSAGMVFAEGLNNLFTNIYIQEHPIEPWGINYKIAREEMNGFVWMSSAMKFMDNFSFNRNIYSTIDEFMPQLVSFLNYTADNIEFLMTEHNLKYPRILNIFPATGSIVSPDIKEIRIQFSHRMVWEIGTALPEDKSLQMPFGKDVNKEYWTEDGRTLIFPVNLEKNKSYGFNLTKGFFRSSDCYPMKDTFEIRFSTTE